jgi:hypothetical protein
VAKVHPLVKWAAYLPPEQGTPKADEQPVMYLAVVQDSSIPGDLNTDTGIAVQKGQILVDLFYETYAESVINGAIQVNVYVVG